jgi:cell wall assembly regulator SMI1
MPIDFVVTFWRRIERWVAIASLPGTVLNAPATERELAALDAALVTGLPAGLRQLLASHNGAGEGWFCFAEGYFLSTTQIIALRAERSNAASRFDADAGSPDCLGTVRPLWWSELWIPFLRRNKEPVCIDLDPAPGGEVGQIIEIDWEGRCNRVLAPNLDAFLAEIADSLA